MPLERGKTTHEPTNRPSWAVLFHIDSCVSESWFAHQCLWARLAQNQARVKRGEEGFTMKGMKDHEDLLRT